MFIRPIILFILLLILLGTSGFFIFGWINKNNYSYQTEIYTCEQLPDYYQSLKTFEDNKEIARKIAEIGGDPEEITNGYKSSETMIYLSKLCDNKSKVIITVKKYEYIQKVKNLIGNNYFELPYSISLEK
jgi:hypothetical protein